MTGLAFVVGATVNALIIGFFARRLLGAPVGWPRTIVLSVGVNFGISPLLAWVTGMLGLESVAGHAVSGVAEAAVVTLVILWVLVAEVIALVICEALVPTGSVPSPWALLRRTPAWMRRAARYTAILRIAAAHGLTAYLRPRRTWADAPESKVARSLREALTEGGVTFVKLGQMLATRPDLLPPAYIDELSQLHSAVPPEPWEAVRHVLETEWGRPVEEVLDSIDPEPIAAASVAQAYLARLRDGTEVVVKIQRGRARAQVTADLDIVLRLAQLLHRRAEWARTLGVLTLADGFAQALEEELDYRVELANMLAVAADSGDVRVPTPYPELSGRHVLVMQRLSGRPLSDAQQVLAVLTLEQRGAMAQTLLATVLRQVVVSGVFHADLHPGNIVVDTDASVALLDFGSVGRLDRSSRTSMSTLLLAFDRQDAIAATDALIDLLDAPVDLDDRALERQIGQLIVRHSSSSGTGASADLYLALFKLVLAHRLTVPAPIAAAFRALAALEESLQRLTGGEWNLVAAARQQGRSLMAETLAPAQVRSSLETQLATVLPLLQRLPRRLNHLTSNLESGAFTVNVRAFVHEDDRSFITGVIQQVVVAMLAAALALGGILLMVADAGPTMTEGLPLYTFLGMILMLFAFVLGSRALVLVFRQAARTHDQPPPR